MRSISSRATAGMLALAWTWLVVTGAWAQVPPAAQQIAAAVAPAPAEHQAAATVLGYTAEGRLVTLREGDGELVCLADEPGDDRFHVACYHRSLEPFMARGRALRAEGKGRDEVEAARLAEIEAGTLPMPTQAAMLYSLTGPAGAFDPSAGTVADASRLTVVYMPGATTATTGLPTSAPAGQPWLMAPGKPWAHIMLVHPKAEQ